VADAYHGLRVVSPDADKVSRPVAPQWWQGKGRTFCFANGVEVDPDTGAVYFTETSTRLQRREFLRIVISGDTTGRLLRYDPKSGKVEVLVDVLAFPNGLAMSRDGTHLLLAESTTGRILRYWLRRPAAKANAPALEEVALLPWFPDNIRMSPRGRLLGGAPRQEGEDRRVVHLLPVAPAAGAVAADAPCPARIVAAQPARAAGDRGEVERGGRQGDGDGQRSWGSSEGVQVG
jgi:sugar lactone lactonase YvrE